MLTVAVLGMGCRGKNYSSSISKNPNAKIVAVCEKNPKVLEFWRKKLNLTPDQVFLSDEDFFKQGKLADTLVIATQDRDHFEHAMKALNLGYELLLEKPVSPVFSECQQIADLAKEKNLRVVVCHVLRYATFYDQIKTVIDNGTIGKVVSINITENIAYWHYSHSYVRGNWRNEALSAPSILAKCCHDLDMIYYLTGKKCQAVFSTATRAQFVPEKCPPNAADFCADCKVKNCPYEARKIYYDFTRYTIPKMGVYRALITGKDGSSLKEFKEVLKRSPYGRCVYKCDNDVMENQNVALKLADNVSANLTMTAFSKRCYRRLYISGTKGEIIGCDVDGKFKLNVFGGKCKMVRVPNSGLLSHLGGDIQITKDFVQYMTTNQKAKKLSTIDVTLESHKVASAAEISRKTGKSVDI